VRKCLACVKRLDRYLSGWFHGAELGDIYKDNLGEFLAWAFLDRDQLPARGSEEAEEVAEYVRQFEEVLGRELPQGYNRNVRSLRLTLDPVKMTHRSLAWYCVS
jgi:transcription elongation factor SPT5